MLHKLHLLPIHHVGTIPTLQFGDSPVAKHKLVEKIYVSLTLNSYLSLLVIPCFSLAGRMTDRRLIGELWISVPSSQILGGIQPITAQGHQGKVQRVDTSEGCTLSPNGTAECQQAQYSWMRRRRNG